MSTKIHHGYRLPASVGIPALARDLALRAEPVRRELALRAVAVAGLVLASGLQTTDGLSDAVRMLSYGQLEAADLRPSGPWPSDRIVDQACGIVDAVQAVLARPFARRVPAALDLAMSVAFVSDPAGGDWTYALLYCDAGELAAVWESTAGVEPWPYWDNADSPDGLSEHQWSERGAAWDRALGRCSPAEVGITWTMPQDELCHAARRGRSDGGWLTIDAVLDAAGRLPAIGAGPRASRGQMAASLSAPAIAAASAPGA